MCALDWIRRSTERHTDLPSTAKLTSVAAVGGVESTKRNRDCHIQYATHNTHLRSTCVHNLRHIVSRVSSLDLEQMYYTLAIIYIDCSDVRR